MMPTNVPAIIYTGGTFGCAGEPLTPLTGDVLTPYLKQISDALNQPVSIYTVHPTIDSSQATPLDWYRVLKQILTLYQQGITRFIIITGTDTLSYFAAFLAIGLEQIPVSVILVASQYPLLISQAVHPYAIHQESDAYQNFCLALNAVHLISGVLVSVDGQLLEALSLQKIHTQQLPAFTGQPFKQMPLINNAMLPQKDADISLLLDDKIGTALSQTHIAVLYALPKSAQMIMHELQFYVDNPPYALIILAFGSGNWLDDARIKALLMALTHKNCLLFMGTQVPFGGTHAAYAAGEWSKDINMIALGQRTLSAVYAKLLWLYITPFTYAQRWQILHDWCDEKSS